MNSDVVLLECVYHNSVNAIGAISYLLKKVEVKELFDLLFPKMGEYQQIAEKAISYLKNHNTEPAKENFFNRLSFFVGIKVAASNKASAKKIAQLLKNASLEGIYDVADYININVSANKESKELAFLLIKTEQDNVLKMENFLETNKNIKTIQSD